jgi:glycosyltransferase involved in cell wall biosynthesis
MRRVLLVFEPPDGGVPAHVLELARGLGEHGWSPLVAGPAQGAAYEEFERAGVRAIRLPMGRELDPLAYASSLRRLVGLMRGGRFDLVHAHSSKAGVLARLAADATRTPAVYTPHCFAFARPGPRFATAGVVAIERALAALTRAVLCVAQDERRLALHHRVAPAERLHVVHNGCAACDGAATPDPELAAFAGSGPLAACVTVLRPQKAVDTFVRAAPEVLRAVPEARLAVVGNGEMRPSLEREARELGLDGRFGFFAFRPPAVRQLRQLDVFVLPSAWEAFPISLIEAMACGVPQLATAVGGTPEAVRDGETGLLCPPRDPAALARALVALLSDPQRRERMAKASRERHAEAFTVERMVASTAAVYEAALSEPALD